VTGTLAVAVFATLAFLYWEHASPPEVSRPAPETFLGAVRETSALPIPGAVVKAMFVAGDDGPRELARAITRPNGSYELRAPLPLETGVLVLSVEATGFGTAGRHVEPTDHKQDFVLVRGSTTVTTHVVTEQGDPVAGAEVIVSLEPLAAEPDAVVMFSGESDASGAFVVASLPVNAGTLHVSAVAAGKGRAVETRSKAAGDAPIHVRATLDAGTAVAGQVVDARGKPIEGVSLRVGEVEGPWVGRTRSTSDGQFLVTAAPRDAQLSIEVEGDWVLTTGQDSLALVSPHRDPPARVRVTVEPAGRIEGRILAAGGPVAGVHISAAPVDRTFGGPREMVSGLDGTFALRGLRSATSWDLEARHASYAPAFAEAVVVPSRQLTLYMTAGGSLAGRVLDSGRGPYRGIEIYAHRVTREQAAVVGLREYASAQSDGEGRFRIDHLNPGDYRVEYRLPSRMAYSPSAATTRAPVVRDGSTTALEDAVIERSGSLRLIVPVLAETKPAWISVSLLPSGKGGAPHRAAVLASAPGVFEIAALEPDTYDVSIQHGDHGYAHAREVQIESGKTSEARFEFPGSGILEGRVLDATGTPVPGASIDAYVADSGGQAAHLSPGRAPDNFSGNTARSSADGSFRLPGLRAVPHRVRVEKQGQAPVETTIAVRGRSDQVTLRLPRPASLEVALPPSAANKIVVIKTNDGGGQRESAITDVAGIARFPALIAGTYDVTPIASGFSSERVVLAAGDARQVTLAGSPTTP
jgi:hypothetical protein